MNNINNNIIKYKILPFFSNEINCCTDITLYNLLFVNKNFKKILKDTKFIKNIYKIINLSNKCLCRKCNNFNILKVISYFNRIKVNNKYSDKKYMYFEFADAPSIFSNYYKYTDTIHFKSNKELNNFINFLKKNNIKKLILLSKCCGGVGGTFKYIKN